MKLQYFAFLGTIPLTIASPFTSLWGAVERKCESAVANPVLRSFTANQPTNYPYPLIPTVSFVLSSSEQITRLAECMTAVDRWCTDAQRASSLSSENSQKRFMMEVLVRSGVDMKYIAELLVNWPRSRTCPIYLNLDLTHHEQEPRFLTESGAYLLAPAFEQNGLVYRLSVNFAVLKRESLDSIAKSLSKDRNTHLTQLDFKIKSIPANDFDSSEWKQILYEGRNVYSLHQNSQMSLEDWNTSASLSIVFNTM